VAHLFIRDPLVVYKDRVKEVKDEVDSDHFENIQSTNWQSLRFKPPPAPAGKNIGWRVEFRTMEVIFNFFAWLSRPGRIFFLNIFNPHIGNL
jgi:glutamate--cysteine ligase catalytic subunit